MGKIRRPTVIASILFFATLALVVGAVAALSLPMHGWMDRSAAASAPLPSATATASAPATVPVTVPTMTAAQPVPDLTTSAAAPESPSAAATKNPSSDESITYTVKRGDTLSDIAAWFKQHGYEDLYAANKSVIGSNPDLIYPGERIVIKNGQMTIQDPKS